MKNLGLPLSISEKLESLTVEKCEEIEEIIQVAAAADDALLISVLNLKWLHRVRLPQKSIMRKILNCFIS